MTWSRVDSLHEVFATSAFTGRRQVGGAVLAVPTGVVHGKEMGTTTTLCGIATQTWTKFWDQPFDRVTGQRCAECVCAAATRERRVGRH